MSPHNVLHTLLFVGCIDIDRSSLDRSAIESVDGMNDHRQNFDVSVRTSFCEMFPKSCSVVPFCYSCLDIWTFTANVLDIVLLQKGLKRPRSEYEVFVSVQPPSIC